VGLKALDEETERRRQMSGVVEKLLDGGTVTMVHLRRIVAKLRNILANKRAEEELAREVASHLTLLVDDFERRVCRLKKQG
jgi:hypothetical protein